MSPELLLQFVAAASCVVAAGWLWRRDLAGRAGTRSVLLGLLVLAALIHLGEGLEWLDLPQAGRITENLGILVPAVWLFLLFTLGSDQLVEEAFSKETQLQAVLTQAPVPLAILGEDGQYLATSECWNRLFHPSGPIALDRSPVAQGFVGQLVEELDGARFRATEPLPLPLPSGTQWVLWGASPWSSTPGVPGGHVVVLNLVTEAVEAEGEDQALQVRLERVNRTDLVALLASGVAHDVRNFLMVVQAHADLLEAAEGDAGAQESIQAIHQAVDLSADVLQTLTNLTRKELPQPRSLDLVRLVDRAGRMLRRTLPPGTQLLIELPTQPVQVEGVSVKLQQVLLNLVSNARDAMPEGGAVTLSLWATEQRAILQVEDTGQGISPELQERIFERLFTTKELGQGTGLGLAIVAGIVRDHGGEIEVDSAPGQGASFRISLPRIPSAAISPGPRPGQGSGPGFRLRAG